MPRLILELDHRFGPPGANAEPQPYFWFRDGEEARRAIDWLVELRGELATRTGRLDWRPS